MPNFGDSLSNFNTRTIQEIQRVKKGVTIALFSAIIEDTPVLTGRLRGNWKFSVGSPNRSTSSQKDRSGSIAVQSILRVVSRSQDDDSIWMSNSLPYVSRIEYEGWSHTKSPQGMVRKNTSRFEEILSRALRTS